MISKQRLVYEPCIFFFFMFSMVDNINSALYRKFQTHNLSFLDFEKEAKVDTIQRDETLQRIDINEDNFEMLIMFSCHMLT